jgi:hypothetical protein
MKDRSNLISWIRGELVGPSISLHPPSVAVFNGRELLDTDPDRHGGLVWKPSDTADSEEVLYFERESPHRKYGAGLLHPSGIAQQIAPDTAAAAAADGIGADTDEPDEESDTLEIDDQDIADTGDPGDDDFAVTSPDIRHPSTMGLSFCVRLESGGQVVVLLPDARVCSWQALDETPVKLNGRYERCIRRWKDRLGVSREQDVWRRSPAVLPNTEIRIAATELQHGRRVSKDVPLPLGSPLALKVDVFARRQAGDDGLWLLTAVLRNVTGAGGDGNRHEAILYQSFFEVVVTGGSLEPYPESRRVFSSLDPEEQSLALLYRESATWGIGHGCSAGWDAEPGVCPTSLFADVMPAVQIPSMTADVTDEAGNPIQLSMRELSTLGDEGNGAAWQALEMLNGEYRRWIDARRAEVATLPHQLQPVAREHITACEACVNRIGAGIDLLRRSPSVRRAFRLANLTMLLQQISTKALPKRPLEAVAVAPYVRPAGTSQSPWDIFASGRDSGVGMWRAFQIAFLLMSLDGISSDDSSEREIVDLIWFPTGGGKTEAYLGVAAFYLFHERFREPASGGMQRDGTNVLMRYTLRMLTTQQFQRAAALICAMEFLRRHPDRSGEGLIPGVRFSLGLWIGGDGSPNSIRDARAQVSAFRRGSSQGNPLILTECPWCRGQIGRFEGQPPTVRPAIRAADWASIRVRGISEPSPQDGPMLHCPDARCAFGRPNPSDWLPVEVIDERIYLTRPSIVIGTADKLAMIAYRPAAGRLFGRSFNGDRAFRSHVPPGLIIQDELHLISGPLGTMYAFYETIFEQFCSHSQGDRLIRPKLIASTATIRGAADQVRSLYDRADTRLFPSPGLLMGDSFFGRYSRSESGSLSPGRMYLGIHASDYGSILTTQVRTYSAALFRAFQFPEERRDPWWTLLAFYNSIRELGGAKTLFESDIRSRLKFTFNREGHGPKDRRNLRIVEELTSRLSQTEIVAMMDRLTVPYQVDGNQAMDACLASNIIEVGVDIDRLSLMGVVGQPKTTAQYIQVTGRVGRRWWERPGLILMLYNPSKSRDRSHFEQFHTYHRRLYERVEPTSATPFALSAIQRALPGVLIAYARQFVQADVGAFDAFEPALRDALALLKRRCASVQVQEDVPRSLDELDRVFGQVIERWRRNPQLWEEFPPDIDGHYLMLWPGQYRTKLQEHNGIVVASSMRQVDASAELSISPCYAFDDAGIPVGGH